MPRPPTDARAWTLLLLGAAGPVAALLLCFQFGVPLGKPGTLVYPYSAFADLRLAALVWLAPPTALLAAGAWMSFAGEGWKRRIGLGMGAAGVLGVGMWVFLAPPRFASQHFFNFSSPSQDGAFALEARRVGDVREYLRDFPDRARQPPAAMKGTRVISNPPATTLLALGVDRALDAWPALGRGLSRLLPAEERTDAALVDLATRALALGVAFSLLWLLATVPIYATCRLYLAPGPAFALATVAVISPMTLLFSPGKDPAQLLTTGLLLWSWLSAWRSRSLWRAALFGGLAVVTCMVSLVHIWVAWVLVVASGWATIEERDSRRRWLRLMAAAAGGAVAAAVALRLGLQLDVIATARAIQSAQSAVTQGPTAMPLAWQALGIPLFALFGGAALSALALWRSTERSDDAAARLGGRMVILCLVVMGVTIGYTNAETPRLWLPFTPLLLLGLALQLPLLRQPRPPTAALLTALVALQVVAAAAQWSLMDMREAELRLMHDAATTPRLFD